MEERTPINTSDFLEERIKIRPRNRKRIFLRAIEVAILAVLFGLIACVTMVFLSPILEERLFPIPKTTTEVKFPEESVQYPSKEVLPQDMLLEDKEKEETPVEVVEEIDTEERFKEMVYFLREKAGECKKWLVLVNGVASETSWLESTSTSSSVATGAIIADNETEWLVLVERECLEKADRIEVTFVDEFTAAGYLKGEDPDSGIAVVAVAKEDIPTETLESCAIVEMASSNNKLLEGNVVMAMGNLNGVNNMIGYGFVTARGIEVNCWDINYKLVMTNMYGSKNPNGFLVNMKGQLLGVLCNDYNSEDAANMMSALGISELKKKIEHLSNVTRCASLGIKGTDITFQAYKELNIPDGAYVLSVKLDSPAMLAGIQAGDIIVGLNGKDVSSMNTLTYYLNQLTAGEMAEVVLMRQSQGVYKESTTNIVLGN